MSRKRNRVQRPGQRAATVKAAPAPNSTSVALRTSVAMTKISAGSFDQRPRADWNFSEALKDRKDFPRGSGESVASALTRNHSDIVRMTRYAVRMNGFAARPVDVSVAYGVGKGMAPVCPNPLLIKLWKRWTKHAGAEGLGDYGFVQEQAWREWWIGGEAFGYLRYRRGKKAEGLVVPLQVQILSTEMVPTSTPFAPNARAGQLYDIEGDVTDYYLHKSHPGDKSDLRALVADEVVKVPADRILHVMKQQEAGARRGEPWLTRALVKIADLEKYYGAELTRKILTSNVAYWLKLPDYTDEEKAELADTFYDKSTGTYRNSAGEEVEAPVETVVAPAEDGTVVTLPNGAEIQQTTPAESGNTFAPFVREIKLAIASSVNIPMEFLYGDVAGLNDRIYKGLAQQFERQIDTWRRDFNAMFNIPVWNAFVRLVVDAGLWSPGEGETIDDYLNVDFVGQPFPNLHRAQEVSSWEQEVEAGFATRADIVRRQGDDPQRVRAEATAELVADIEAGLKPIPAHWTDAMIRKQLSWSDADIRQYRELSRPSKEISA